MSEEIRELPNTAVPHRETARRTRDAEPAEQLEISVYLKPLGAQSGDAAVAAGRRETREQMRVRRVVEHAGDIGAVEDFAARHGLRVVSAEPGQRRVRLAGSTAQFGAAFHTSLGMYDAGEGEFRSYSGTLSVPGPLGDRIESVLGLDNRRMARPFIVPSAATDAAAGYLPNEAAALYNFPANVTGADQCIALLEFGGGYYDSDVTAAFAAMNLPAPTVVAVGVDGAHNNPGTFILEDNEVAMDIQIAGGLAGGAKVAVYFAPFTVQGWVDAITTAAHDMANAPSVISVSWGEREAMWGLAEMASVTSALNDAATLGLSVFAACGDSRATNGSPGRTASVNFPASSPGAIGCGGTSITTSGSSITSEVTWNGEAGGTGGGISDYLDVPAFQAGTVLPPNLNDGQRRRGVPDVAGNADPLTGYSYIYDGKTQKNAGTSAVAPLWAGLAARLNELKPGPETIGFFLPLLYQYPTAVRDITAGNNKPSSAPDFGYDAGPGWDACTGLGVPDGGRLAALLASTVRSGTAIAATAWWDGNPHIRVFGQNLQWDLSQFDWDGNWTTGVSLPGTAPTSKPYAMQWWSPQGTVVSVIYQDARNTLREERYSAGSWAPGPFVVPGAAPGSSIAAMTWSDPSGLHLRVYYQDTGGTIREQCYDDGTGVWQPGQFTAPSAAPGTSLAAVSWSDAGTGAAHLRVYYQDTGGLIHEQSAESGQWQPDRSFGAAPGSGLAVARWLDIANGAHLRVYYQDPENVIREQCYDTGAWVTGSFVVPTQ
jgi:kumamolisin